MNEVWSVKKIDPNGITVVYKEKYGPLVEVKCIGLWETDTKYRLTNKDAVFTELLKSNLTSIEVK